MLKRTMYFVFVASQIILFSACGIHIESPAAAYFAGEHELRKMVYTSESKASLRGTYFLVAGGVSGEFTTQTIVTFSWKNNRGDYVITSLPIEKLRVRFDDSVKIPGEKSMNDREKKAVFMGLK